VTTIKVAFKTPLTLRATTLEGGKGRWRPNNRSMIGFGTILKIGHRA